MVIAAAEIPALIHPSRTEIPVQTYAATLAFKATPIQILNLVAADAIEGIVSPKKGQLRYIRLTVSERKARRIAGIARGSRKGERLPSAEDNMTIIRERLTFSHNGRRSRAFNPMADMLEHLHVCRKLTPEQVAVELGMVTPGQLAGAKRRGEPVPAVEDVTAALKRLSLWKKRAA